MSHMVTETAFHEQLKTQLRTHINCQKTLWLESKLDGHSSIKDNDALLQTLDKWKLTLPADHAVVRQCRHPQALAAALKAESIEEMHTFDLSSGPSFEWQKRVAVESAEAMQLEFVVDLEGAHFIFSPLCLFQLDMLTLRRDGTRQINVDGTGGFFKDGFALITLGANSVRCRADQRDVTSSLRPILCLGTGGERFHVCNLTLCALRMLCWKLFGAELTVDWGTSDHANAFVNSHLFFGKCPHLCDGVYRETLSHSACNALTADNGVDPTPIETIKELEALNADNEEMVLEEMCDIVSQLTQDADAHAEDVPSFPESVPSGGLMVEMSSKSRQLRWKQDFNKVHERRSLNVRRH